MRIAQLAVLAVGLFHFAFSYAGTPEDTLDLGLVRYKTPERALVYTSNSKVLESALKKSGLVDVTSTFQTMASELKFESVFVSADLKKTLLLRYDFEPVNKALIGRTLKVGFEAAVIHSSDASHRPVVIYGVGFQKEELVAIAHAVTQLSSQVLSSHSSNWLLREMVKPAFADDKTCANSAPTAIQDIEKLGGFVVKQAGPCLKKFGDGIYAGLIGDNIDLLSGKVFSQMGLVIKVVATTVQDLSKNLTKMYVGLEKHPEILAQLICEFVGSTIGTAITSAILGPVAAAFKATASTIHELHEAEWAILAVSAIEKATIVTGKMADAVEDSLVLRAGAHIQKNGRGLASTTSTVTPYVTESLKSMRCHAKPVSQKKTKRQFVPDQTLDEEDTAPGEH
jgi:hypothetical protein